MRLLFSHKYYKPDNNYNFLFLYNEPPQDIPFQYFPYKPILLNYLHMKSPEPLGYFPSNVREI